MEQEKEEKKTTEEMRQKVKDKVEKVINRIVDDDLQEENVELLGELIDIHKDLANEEYWQIKEEAKYMRYMNDSYGRRMRDGRGRYMEGNYGRRGRGRYRGEDMMDEMHEHLGNYSESKEEYGRGNYGAAGETVEHLQNMGECAVELVEALMEEADTPEEKKMIKKYAKKIHETAQEMM